MNLNRREALALFAAGGAAATALAQDGAPKGRGPGRGKEGAPPFVPTGPALPLKTTGLEHIGVTVPNPEASAKFYGQIFDPQLFKERDIANRFYCRLGKAYLAFGTKADVKQPTIDHICALVENYNRLLGMRGGVVVDEDEMPGRNAVARFQRHAAVDFGAVEHGSVLASEVAESPAVAVPLDRKVLARESAIVREREFGGAGAAERNPIRVQRNEAVLPVGRQDLEFFHRVGMQVVLCYAGAGHNRFLAVTPR